MYYKTTDYTGLSCIHYAPNRLEAIRKHRIHFSIEEDCHIEVEELHSSIDKTLVCQDIYCNKKHM